MRVTYPITNKMSFNFFRLVPILTQSQTNRFSHYMFVSVVRQ